MSDEIKSKVLQVFDERFKNKKFTTNNISWDGTETTLKEILGPLENLPGGKENLRAWVEKIENEIKNQDSNSNSETKEYVVMNNTVVEYNSLASLSEGDNDNCFQKALLERQGSNLTIQKQQGKCYYTELEKTPYGSYYQKDTVLSGVYKINQGQHFFSGGFGATTRTEKTYTEDFWEDINYTDVNVKDRYGTGPSQYGNRFTIITAANNFSKSAFGNHTVLSQTFEQPVSLVVENAIFNGEFYVLEGITNVTFLNCCITGIIKFVDCTNVLIKDSVINNGFIDFENDNKATTAVIENCDVNNDSYDTRRIFVSTSSLFFDGVNCDNSGPALNLTMKNIVISDYSIIKFENQRGKLNLENVNRIGFTGMPFQITAGAEINIKDCNFNIGQPDSEQWWTNKNHSIVLTRNKSFINGIRKSSSYQDPLLTDEEFDNIEQTMYGVTSSKDTPASYETNSFYVLFNGCRKTYTSPYIYEHDFVGRYNYLLSQNNENNTLTYTLQIQNSFAINKVNIINTNFYNQTRGQGNKIVFLGCKQINIDNSNFNLDYCKNNISFIGISKLNINNSEIKTGLASGRGIELFDIKEGCFTNNKLIFVNETFDSSVLPSFSKFINGGKFLYKIIDPTINRRVIYQEKLPQYVYSGLGLFHVTNFDISNNSYNTIIDNVNGAGYNAEDMIYVNISILTTCQIADTLTGLPEPGFDYDNNYGTWEKFEDSNNSLWDSSQLPESNITFPSIWEAILQAKQADLNNTALCKNLKIDNQSSIYIFDMESNLTKYYNEIKIDGTLIAPNLLESLIEGIGDKNTTITNQDKSISTLKENLQEGQIYLIPKETYNSSASIVMITKDSYGNKEYESLR